MTVCGISKADGVCVMGKCPYIKKCCPVVWDKGGEPMTDMEKMFEKMLNMEMSKEEMYGQCRNVAHEPQTNEKWLKRCTTEQLATFLAIVQYDGTDLTLKKNHVEKWVEWLKQPHT